MIDTIGLLITAVVLPLISILCSKLIAFINEKVEDKQHRKYLVTILEDVSSSVKTVYQTYVEGLKKNKLFNVEEQKLALSKAKTMVLSELNDNLRNYILNTYGDIDLWIESQIESAIYNLKNYSKDE